MKTNLLFLAGLFCLFSAKVRASEVFVRVNKAGSYYASSGGQTQYNPSNTFRFFDLAPGNVYLQIADQNNGSLLYSGNLTLGANQRLVAEIDHYGSLRIVQTLTVFQQNWYSFNEQYAVTNQNPYGPYASDISLFLQQLDKESMDSSKLRFAKSYVDKGWFTATQIAEICKRFTFDSNRLDFAKHAYARCSDPQNYFVLREFFTFSSNFSDLQDFVDQH